MMYESQLSNLTARLTNAARETAGMPEESRQAWLAAIEGEIDAMRTEIERNQNVEPANRFRLLQQLEDARAIATGLL
jgi:CRISPR/Cas system-associated protein Csm6